MPGTIVLATRQFSQQDQELFAQLSGDWNPMHMDQVAARRTAAGAAVVHGMHLILWMTDMMASIVDTGSSIIDIKAKFIKWVYIDEPVNLVLVQKNTTEVHLQVEVEGLVRATATFALGKRSIQIVERNWNVSCQRKTKPVAVDRDLEEISQTEGFIEFATPPDELAQAFPSAVRILGSLEMSGLACSTRLVGMECPGLHSIFAGFNVQFSDDLSRTPGLNFAVSTVNKHFRYVKIKISGAGLNGTVDSFARIPPVAQPSMEDMTQAVIPGEFAGSQALIVGGSRGLGEVCAKAIAAGGGKVTITYGVGKEEAEKVAREINEWGGECKIMHYDVCQPAVEQLRRLATAPGKIYYFATGAIYKPRPKRLDFKALDEFLEFYVRGFYGICEAHRTLYDRQFTAFYPSTIFVEKRPDGMAEYAMAKSAGEAMCDELPRLMPGLRVVMRRLPRLLTDQTASVTPTKEASVVEIMLPIIREVHASANE